jgi:hypothetical protein
MLNDHAAAAKSTDEKWVKHVGRYDKCRHQFRAKATELSERHAELEAHKVALAEKHGGSSIKGTDKLKLNVGGERVTVRRETLTQFPKSRLATLFSGRWENRLLRDKKKQIFLDVNPACFKKIVDYHNLVKIADPQDPPELPEVAAEDQETFNRLCAFFGLTIDREEDAKPAEVGAPVEEDEKKDGWQTLELDALAPDIVQALTAEMESLCKAEAQLAELENAFSEEEAFIEFFASGETKDVIDLDVSGEKMTVKRSTLMLCKESALARQFDDAVWSTQQQEAAADSDSDDDGVMIEQSAYCFGKIVDYLRLRAIAMPGVKQPPPPVIVEHQRKNFGRVVSFYFPGVEDFIIPPCSS